MFSQIPAFPSREGKSLPDLAKRLSYSSSTGPFASLCHNNNNYSHWHVQNLPFSPQLAGRSLSRRSQPCLCAQPCRRRVARKIHGPMMLVLRGPVAWKRMRLKSEHSTPDFPKLRSASSGSQKDGQAPDFLAGIRTDRAGLGNGRARRTFGLGPCLAHVRYEGIGGSLEALDSPLGRGDASGQTSDVCNGKHAEWYES